MQKLSISIVIYNPDITLLNSVLSKLKSACLYNNSFSYFSTSVDIINNNPYDNNINIIRKLALFFYTSNFKVDIVEAGRNLGYGAGNNISIKRHANSDYHLVINPDVLVEIEALYLALKYMNSNPSVGLLTPQVLNFDNSRQYLCKRNPTLLDMLIRSFSSSRLNRIFADRIRKYEFRDHNYENIIFPVPYPTGCFMFFRRSILGAIGGFDENFFLHYEDADIGRRLSIVSLSVYVPSVIVLHKWSRDSHKSWGMRWITIKSGIRYFVKWGGIL